jgi:hypothetical protein
MLSLERCRECYRTLPKLCRSTYSRKDSNKYSDCRLRCPDTPEMQSFFSLAAGISSHVGLQLKKRTNGHDPEPPCHAPQRLTHSRQRLRRLHLPYVRYWRLTRATDEHVTLTLPATGSSETLVVIYKTIGVPPQKI